MYSGTRRIFVAVLQDICNSSVVYSEWKRMNGRVFICFLLCLLQIKESHSNCSELLELDLVCHNSSRFPVWCQDMEQPTCYSPGACCELCEENKTAGGDCVAWSFNNESKKCYMKSVPPPNSPCTICQSKPGKPTSKASDVSGRIVSR